MLTQERLKEALHYNKETGAFIRLIKRPNCGVGDSAGSITANGYLEIGVYGGSYTAHRLAFLYVDGYFPEGDVDHKNGNKTDNTWLNLRHVTRTCNSQNVAVSKLNSSGITGVGWSKCSNKWAARIVVGGKSWHLGVYASKLEAALARFTEEVWNEKWTCNYRGFLVAAIKKEWPDFNQGCV